MCEERGYLVLNSVWSIPLFPLIAFAAIVLCTNPHKKLSSGLATGAIAISWLLGWSVAATAFVQHLGYGEDAFHILTHWAPTGRTWLTMGVQVDPLAAIMLFMVPFVCLMIFIYSWGYMGLGTEQVDPRYSRFFAYISLFACGMLGLVVADNYVMLLLFWEIMGLCSYLLIGFWFEKNYPDPKRITPREAGLKAFLTTRIGDVIMLSGLLLLYSRTGTLTFSEVFSEGTLHGLATTPVPALGIPWAALIAMLIFGGAVGKSAQFPLHVWLPDAMEGPTPVSALIHAATMVSAGVYLVARTFPLLSALEQGPHWGLIAFIGAFTALFASTIALAQDDIKRVLAYSTISQLGYMIAALGIGAYVAALFHLITHAFFKALLFLGSGSVIHGMEHGHHQVAHEHGSFDANDMMNMGGLGRKMPRTTWSFLAGTLALAGVVPFAGFWSKDEILAHAWEEFLHQGVVSWPFFVWLLLTVAAFLTAFYMGRQLFLVFTGPPRTEAAAHAHESPGSMTWPLLILALFAATLGLVGTPWANLFHHLVGGHFPATPFSRFVALLSTAMALGGLFAGWWIYGRRPLTVGQPDPLVKALGPVHTLLNHKYYVDELYQATFIRGTIALADLLFQFDHRWVIDPLVNRVGWATVTLSGLSNVFDVHFIDGLVNLAGRATVIVSTLSRLFDTYVVDGLVRWVGIATGKMGRGLRLIQTGQVQNYLLLAFVSVLMLLGLYSIR